jgi:hypothetical protein
MMIIAQTTQPVTDGQLLKALEILVSPVLGALSMAHALGGQATSPEWMILEQHTPRQIVDEIIERGLSLEGRLATCSRVLVLDTPVMHMILDYDPRPRCSLCCRRHYVDKRTGEPLSCGDAQGFRNPPTHRWTRAARETAL